MPISSLEVEEQFDCPNKTLLYRAEADRLYSIWMNQRIGTSNDCVYSKYYKVGNGERVKHRKVGDLKMVNKVYFLAPREVKNEVVDRNLWS